MEKAIGSAFGPGASDQGAGGTAGPAAKPAADPSSVTLPPGFEKFLGS